MPWIEQANVLLRKAHDDHKARRLLTGGVAFLTALAAVGLTGVLWRTPLLPVVPVVWCIGAIAIARWAQPEQRVAVPWIRWGLILGAACALALIDWAYHHQMR